MNENQNIKNELQDTAVWNNWMTVMNAAEPYIPEGQYEADLVDAQISRSKSSNRPQFDITYRIDSLEKEAHSYFVLDSEKGSGHIKRWAFILGVNPPHDPRDILSFLNQVVSQRFRCLIQIINNNGFVFALLLKKIDREKKSIRDVPVTPVKPPKAAAQSQFLHEDLL